MTDVIRVGGASGYDVVVGNGILDGCARLIAGLEGARTALVVSDDAVFPLYGEKLRSELGKAGLRAVSFVFPHGEQSKNLSTYASVLDAAVSAGLSRRDLICALGGGVTGDLAGFAAATYLRGIRYVQIPTTLLAAVDSSVGGKTGIDLPGGKNLAGAFKRPSLVLCDTGTLDTLPDEQIRNGTAEVIKYAMIGSEELFDRLCGGDPSGREEIIRECVKMKKRFVEEDEFDTGCRMLLNFGHTFGHAAEKCSGFRLPHGFGVAAGMAVVTRSAERLGYCPSGTYEKLASLLSRTGLPTEPGYPAKDLVAAALSDKKRDADSITLIIPEKIGRCRAMKIPVSRIGEWL